MCRTAAPNPCWGDGAARYNRFDALSSRLDFTAAFRFLGLQFALYKDPCEAERGDECDSEADFEADFGTVYVASGRFGPRRRFKNAGNARGGDWAGRN